MGYSIDALTNDCYDGTFCLINKLNIKDEKMLGSIESAITFAKMSELEENPINGNYDFEHYKAIHKFLFEDLYDWAGKIRTIDMSKKGTKFVSADKIEEIAEKCFARLKKENFFKCNDFNRFVDSIVDFYCATNMLHPFREGNGRTQRAFIAQLVRKNGYDIDFSMTDRDEMMVATIHAANGVTDFLKDVFNRIIIDKNIV